MKRHKRRHYYFALILIVGGIGCWISAAQHLLGPTPTSGYTFCGNLGTFAISLAVGAFADHLIISEDKFDPTRALGLLVLSLLALAFGCLPLILMQWIGVTASWLSTILAGAVWWAVHVNNPALDETEAIAALGGNVTS